MPFRRFRDMKEKFIHKYDGALTASRLRVVKQIADERYRAIASLMSDAVEVTRAILKEEGVPTGLHGAYYAFAQEVAKLLTKHRGATLETLVLGKKNFYVAVHGLDADVLERISMALLYVLPETRDYSHDVTIPALTDVDSIFEIEIRPPDGYLLALTRFTITTPPEVMANIRVIDERYRERLLIEGWQDEDRADVEYRASMWGLWAIVARAIYLMARTKAITTQDRTVEYTLSIAQVKWR